MAGGDVHTYPVGPAKQVHGDAHVHRVSRGLRVYVYPGLPAAYPGWPGAAGEVHFHGRHTYEDTSCMIRQVRRPQVGLEAW